ncbi:GntR family transcriptional regulator [Anaerobacillus arseniciselenatis]|uniref:GntR family transcriptional regulator n=1 Tax=Anaerobacillus arseniciselenatis TaxID=85682 RepID=A0A1S2LUZ6_9BACI|nr:GntR family transcriptional regulator [Anaerobacillus arseniciselenatis]OIJ15185.1 GntR family transcriptional regulator [Anaerobacillus arseniciselenatis]
MKLPIRVSEESREPIYHQIETQVKALIVGGHLPPGTPLPSIRALASELTCSVITTRRAYQNLESSGYIKTVQGKGTFVREIETLQKEEAKQKVVYDAFQKAIEQGKQVGCSKGDLLTIFNEVIKRNFDN